MLRLIEEERQLDEKIEKLDAFTKSDAFKGIDIIQQSLLSVQVLAMVTYSRCLNERLKAMNAYASDGSNPPNGPGTPP